MSGERVHAVVVAAGAGRRMQAAMPKQYLPLAGRTVLEHAVAPLLAHPRVARVVVVLAADDHRFHGLEMATDARVRTAAGGLTRSASVIAGLDCLVDEGETGSVLVHDGARPCLHGDDIDRLLAAAGAQGALLAVPVRDTLKRADARGRVETTVARDGLWQALTPQLFPLGALRSALATCGGDATDEAQAMERAGFAPALVEGDAANIKVTRPGDLPLAAGILMARSDGASRQAKES